MKKVHCKAEMYRLLKAGEFGNTNPHWTSLGDWHLETGSGSSFGQNSLWGIRSMKAGGHLRLDVPRKDVHHVAKFEFNERCQISPMIDHMLTYRGEYRFDPACGGHVLRGGAGFKAVKWREFFRDFATNVTGFTALALIQYHMTVADYEDFQLLLEEYPDHVVEFTSCKTFVGTVPRRNTVIWEVRPTDGSYEKWGQPQ